MHWNELDINVNGEHLTHLWFAEVSQMAETLENLNTVPEDISPRVGITRNLKKKFLSKIHVAPAPVRFGNTTLEIVDHYLFPGLPVQLGKFNFEKAVSR
jgi:hypothetical protein